MTEPLSPVARFGVALVGPKIDWGYIDQNGDAATKQFRAAHSITFEELVEYQSMTAFLQAEASLSKKRLDDGLRKLELDDPKAMDLVKELTAQSNQEEAARWAMVISQTMMLIHPGDRDVMRPLLEVGSPTDVRDLRDYLRRIVVDRIVPEVTHAAQLDPTSQPSGTDSPATPESGADSDSTE